MTTTYIYIRTPTRLHYPARLRAGVIMHVSAGTWEIHMWKVLQIVIEYILLLLQHLHHQWLIILALPSASQTSFTSSELSVLYSSSFCWYSTQLLAFLWIPVYRKSVASMAGETGLSTKRKLCLTQNCLICMVASMWSEVVLRLIRLRCTERLALGGPLIPTRTSWKNSDFWDPESSIIYQFTLHMQNKWRYMWSGLVSIYMYICLRTKNF